MSDDHFALYIINGLSPVFENIAAAFRARGTSIGFKELREKLLEHDSYMKRIESRADD